MKKTYSTKKALIASILAMCMCFTMLVGTTFAWFTDAVTSDGNIIKTGTLDVTMEWTDGSNDPEAAATVWKDASKGAMFDYANWEPGYAVARHIKVSNVGTLALNYQMRIVANGIVSKLADVIDVYYFDEDKAAVRDDLNSANYLGTLTEVLGTEKHLSKKVYGSLKAGDPADVHTIILKMQESADNKYQNMDLGCTFSVELIATQMASEADSFDNKYDEQAPIADIPAALVRPLENLNIVTVDGPMTLNAGYQFQPTMGRPEDATMMEPEEEKGHLPYDPENSVENSAYRYWHADFVVKADRDVPANSIVLAGYYSLFGDLVTDGKWVPMTSDTDIAAETEIRLVSALADMTNTAITVSYNDLCLYGNDGKGFQCGLAANDAIALAGTTITVELRMYETPAQGACAIGGGCTHPGEECETGAENYITVGTFTYTFPVLNYVDSAEDMAAELAAGKSVALNKDIVVSSTMNVASGANVDIDLNGHNLSYAVDNNGQASAIIANKGNMKIFGEGTISFVAADPDLGAIPAYATNTITNTGTLVIGEGVVVENGSDGGASYAVDVTSGKFVLDGGTLIGKRCALRIARYNGDAEFVMNSGKVIGATPAWIQLPGSNSNTAPSIKVEINGGTFQSTKDTSADNNVMYTYSFGNSHANTEIVINDGEFLGGTLSIGSGYYGDAPTLTINGGTFEYDVLQWNADSSATVLYAANK